MAAIRVSGGSAFARIRTSRTAALLEIHRLRRELIERHIPWARERHWRPGEPITLVHDGETVTYRLRGVMRDADPGSDFATVSLERVRSLASDADDDDGEDRLSAAG